MSQRVHANLLGWAVVAFLATAGTAAANFDLWLIKEVYSSADGSIQFIELFSDDNNQERLIGESITSMLSMNVYVFDLDLPDCATANRHFLVGTVSYVTAQGAVQPDYVIPDNFFLVSGDTIDYAGVDALTFAMGELPLDGLLSLDAVGTTSPNSPTNFFDEQGQVVPEPSWTLLQAASLAALALIRWFRKSFAPHTGHEARVLEVDDHDRVQVSVS